MNKHLIWAITIFSIVAMLCGTLIWINYNSWTLRFEMDENTKEAIQSIEYPIVNEEFEVYETEPCPSVYCNMTEYKEYVSLGEKE